MYVLKHSNIGSPYYLSAYLYVFYQAHTHSSCQITYSFTDAHHVFILDCVYLYCWYSKLQLLEYFRDVHNIPKYRLPKILASLSVSAKHIVACVTRHMKTRPVIFNDVISPE